MIDSSSYYIYIFIEPVDEIPYFTERQSAFEHRIEFSPHYTIIIMSLLIFLGIAGVSMSALQKGLSPMSLFQDIEE